MDIIFTVVLSIKCQRASRSKDNANLVDAVFPGRYYLYIPTLLKSLGSVRCLNVFESSLLCSTRLHLSDKKYRTCSGKFRYNVGVN